jgi:hypothetical protein
MRHRRRVRDRRGESAFGESIVKKADREAPVANRRPGPLAVQDDVNYIAESAVDRGFHQSI